MLKTLCTIGCEWTAYHVDHPYLTVSWYPVIWPSFICCIFLDCQSLQKGHSVLIFHRVTKSWYENKCCRTGTTLDYDNLSNECSDDLAKSVPSWYRLVHWHSQASLLHCESSVVMNAPLCFILKFWLKFKQTSDDMNLKQTCYPNGTMG